MSLDVEDELADWLPSLTISRSIPARKAPSPGMDQSPISVVVGDPVSRA